jgi:hypothetical protein
VGDYAPFIMKVLNAAIQVAHDNKDDARERTNFEKFTEFNEHLFWLTQQKDYQKFISPLIEKKAQTNKKKAEQNTAIPTAICQKFDEMLTTAPKKEEP